MIKVARGEKIPLSPVIGKSHVRSLGKQQYRCLMLFQPLPQVVGIGFGDSTALAILSGRNGRECFLAPGQDSAVALLQVLVSDVPYRIRRIMMKISLLVYF